MTSEHAPRDRPRRSLRTRGVTHYVLHTVADARGALSFAQVGDPLPFAPQRYFILHDIPSGAVRGEHAHKTLQQFLVCVHGTCTVKVDDGRVKDEITLSGPGEGLFIEPFVWTTVVHHARETAVLVLASEVYLEDDYIRSYPEFLETVGAS